jgi:hypothetical protein
MAEPMFGQQMANCQSGWPRRCNMPTAGTTVLVRRLNRSSCRLPAGSRSSSVRSGPQTHTAGTSPAWAAGLPQISPAVRSRVCGSRTRFSGQLLCLRLAIGARQAAPAGVGQPRKGVDAPAQRGAVTSRKVVPPHQTTGRPRTRRAYAVSASGIAVRYQLRQLPALSPPTRMTARRWGSKTNRTGPCWRRTAGFAHLRCSSGSVVGAFCSSR